MDKKFKENNPEILYKLFDEVSKIKIDVEIIKRDIKWLKYLTYFIIFVFSILIGIIKLT